MVQFDLGFWSAAAAAWQSTMSVARSQQVQEAVSKGLGHAISELNAKNVYRKIPSIYDAILADDDED